jgi:predicted dipeptidase
MYKDDIIRETGELIRFKTYATDVPNRENPEFIKQKEYLRVLAEKLGLRFNDVNGYVQEIWIGDGPESFGLMSHSDVQPADASEWDSDPWSGAIVNGTIRGRGSVDDKGPVVAIMYGMRALLDSGFPLKKKIILLVGTDEESANEDVTTYLKTHAAPDQTIVVDSNYPVICAEKGWCGAWLELPLPVATPAGTGLEIVSLAAGFSASIVPEKATARLVAIGSSIDRYVAIVKQQADDFVSKRAGARITVAAEADTLVITAHGKSVHSADPETGHNALMDLLVFLDARVKPLKNAYSLMAKFGATYIGFELDGGMLGIKYRDSFMGPVTVSGDMFQTTDTTVMFMFNFRIPKGMDGKKIEETLQGKYDAFEKATGVKLKTTHYISAPLYNDPGSPFVQRLLGIYNSVTGERRRPQSIGGGTYAHRIPNAVVFGPALPDEEYLGHQPNEHIKISTLIRNIEILTHTMFDFGM